MSPAGSVGAIMQERVEHELLDVDPKDITRELLAGPRTTAAVLEDLKTDRALFRNLLRSFRHRLDLVQAAGGKNMDKRSDCVTCKKKNCTLLCNTLY